MGYRLKNVSMMQTEYKTTLRMVSLLLVIFIVSVLAAVAGTSLEDLYCKYSIQVDICLPNVILSVYIGVPAQKTCADIQRYKGF